MSSITSKEIQYALGRNVNTENYVPRSFGEKLINSIKWKFRELIERSSVKEQLGYK